jgi:glycosyltransferase involved in cell wall biosynthesis
VKRIKILALVEAFVVSGPAKNILRFAVDCRDRVDFSLVTFIRTKGRGERDDSNNELVSTARNLGIPLHIIWETGPFDLSILGELRQICAAENADIIQTHGVKSHFLVSLLGKRKSRWLAFHHGYTSEDLKVRFYRQFDRWSLRRCDRVVTVCKAFAMMLESRGIPQERIFIVPNSVNTEMAPADAKLTDGTRARWQIPKDDWLVLTAGRLSGEKGHRYLIDAVSSALREIPELKLSVLIAGIGPADGQLKAQVKKNGLDQRVKLIGHCYDVKSLFAIADLFVLPSLSEGSPNVLLESMAARVPIVATSVGGVPEHVTDGESAVLVPPRDSGALAKAMVELLADRPKAAQLATAAFDTARSRFSAAKQNERILTIYNHLLGNQLD